MVFRIEFYFKPTIQNIVWKPSVNREHTEGWARRKAKTETSIDVKEEENFPALCSEFATTLFIRILHCKIYAF